MSASYCERPQDRRRGKTRICHYFCNLLRNCVCCSRSIRECHAVANIAGGEYAWSKLRTCRRYPGHYHPRDHHKQSPGTSTYHCADCWNMGLPDYPTYAAASCATDCRQDKTASYHHTLALPRHPSRINATCRRQYSLTSRPEPHSSYRHVPNKLTCSAFLCSSYNSYKKACEMICVSGIVSSRYPLLWVMFRLPSPTLTMPPYFPTQSSCQNHSHHLCLHAPPACACFLYYVLLCPFTSGRRDEQCYQNTTTNALAACFALLQEE